MMSAVRCRARTGDQWVAGPAGAPADGIVDLDEVARLYTEHGLAGCGA